MALSHALYWLGTTWAGWCLLALGYAAVMVFVWALCVAASRADEERAR